MIPVYNKGRNIVATLAALARADLERFNTCAVIDAPPRDAAQSHGQVGHVDQRINHALKIGFSPARESVNQSLTMFPPWS